MVHHAIQVDVREAVQDRCGSWRVLWNPDDFLIPDIGYFSFKRIVLPLEMVNDAARDSHYLVMKLEDGFQVAILQGSGLKEIEEFRKRVSAEVLKATGSMSYCFDCGKDAGMIPRLWSGSACVGCRGPYCRNPFCLRRLEADCAKDGRPECRSCRASAAQVEGR